MDQRPVLVHQNAFRHREMHRGNVLLDCTEDLGKQGLGGERRETSRGMGGMQRDKRADRRAKTAWRQVFCPSFFVCGEREGGVVLPYKKLPNRDGMVQISAMNGLHGRFQRETSESCREPEWVKECLLVTHFLMEGTL